MNDALQELSELSEALQNRSIGLGFTYFYYTIIWKQYQAPIILWPWKEYKTT